MNTGGALVDSLSQALGGATLVVSALPTVTLAPSPPPPNPPPPPPPPPSPAPPHPLRPPDAALTALTESGVIGVSVAGALCVCGATVWVLIRLFRRARRLAPAAGAASPKIAQEPVWLPSFSPGGRRSAVVESAEIGSARPGDRAAVRGDGARRLLQEGTHGAPSGGGDDGPLALASGGDSERPSWASTSGGYEDGADGAAIHAAPWEGGREEVMNSAPPPGSPDDAPGGLSLH